MVSLKDEAGGVYEMVAAQPLSGRRGKYTLTATDVRGESWYWFSQLWIRPAQGEMANQPVPR